MAEPLYALQRDLDMITDKVYNMERSYNLLDYIAKVVHDCELEQLAQAAQMRRIDQRLAAIEGKLDDLGDFKQRMEAVEKRLSVIEIHLRLITKHLGIQPD